jgi:FkbM family methyltransferase
MTLESWQRRPGPVPALRSAVARPLRSLATPRRLPRGRSIAARATRRAAYLCGRLAHHIAWSTVLPGSQLVARTPAGGRVRLDASTALGENLWETGQFEHEELLWAGRLALPGSCAFDVGANVGVFAVELSRAVGAAGRVIAIEPMVVTAELLRSNLEADGCGNVDIIVAAATALPGQVELQVARDPAHHSTAAQMPYGQIPLSRVAVPGVTLDELWDGAGRPRVSFIKIDVEGAEEDVLRGAGAMIAATRPQLIVEVHDRERLGLLSALLPGYESVVVPGFISWNYLFRPVS